MTKENNAFKEAAIHSEKSRIKRIESDIGALNISETSSSSLNELMFRQNLNQDGFYKKNSVGFNIPNWILSCAIGQNNINHTKFNSNTRKETKKQNVFCQLSDFPTYNNQNLCDSIRMLGRKILEPIPCFNRMAELCRNKSLDPLGEVWTASTYKFNKNIDIEANKLSIGLVLSKLLEDQKFGNIVDAAILNINGVPDYEANIALYASENESVLFMLEPSPNGEELNASYVYIWLGGMNVYNKIGIDKPLSKIGQRDGNMDNLISIESVSTDIVQSWVNKNSQNLKNKFI